MVVVRATAGISCKVKAKMSGPLKYGGKGSTER